MSGPHGYFVPAPTDEARVKEVDDLVKNKGYYFAPCKKCRGGKPPSAFKKLTFLGHEANGKLLMRYPNGEEESLYPCNLGFEPNPAGNYLLCNCLIPAD